MSGDKIIRGQTPPRVCAVTLGCKVNMYDTESILELFRARGYVTVEFGEAADVCIINTCTVTAVSDRKSRQMIRRAAAANPGAVIVATGCFVQAKPGEASAVDGVNIVAGVKDRAAIVDLVENYNHQQGIINGVSGYNIGKIEFENLPVTGLTGRTRAFIKIQDGCENFCSYCAIPYARGSVRSRKLEDIISETRRVAQSEVKEAVISGISVASYGRDTEGSFVDVLRAVCAVDGIRRVRLSSVGPGAVNESFLNAIAELPEICGHFHLSLQSGCDKTLLAMNRRYTADEYAKAVDKIRSVRPGAAITTDIIAGFPGENEEDFLESLNFVKKIGFASLHVFPYSRRAGTAAANMPGAVEKSVRNRRAAQFLDLGNKLRAAFLENAVGSVKSVLFEELTAKGEYKGLSEDYIEVTATADRDIRNELLSVRITDVQGDTANGILL